MSLLSAGWPPVFKGAATVALLVSCWVFDWPGLDAIFVLFTLHAFSLFLRDICGLQNARLVLLGIGGPLGVILSFWMPHLQFVPYLAVIAINLSLAYVFGHNLVRGRPGILLQFVTDVHLGPAPSPSFARYLTQQCALWLLLGLICATLAGLALVAPDLRAFASAALLLLLVAQAMWFGLSHEIARLRYRRPETWRRSINLIMQRKTWDILDI